MSAAKGPIGCYPGSFNPPTVAHLAVAEAAVARARLVRLDLVLSRRALGKDDVEVPTFADRVDLLREVASTRAWLDVVVTDAQLIADIAIGYDVVVMGADKWRQVLDPAWYPDAGARDDAVAGLPHVLVATRAGDRPNGVDLLDLADHHHHVRASAVREGEPSARAWLLPEADAFDWRTGAWTDPGRYRPTAPGG